MSLLLRIDGKVQHPGEWTWPDFMQFPPESCEPDVSRFDPRRMGSAVKLNAVMDRVHVADNARYITLHASADDFHASLPLAEIRDKALLIFSLNGQPLPSSAGGPIRFFIRDHAACHAAEIDECANVKFVDWIEFTVEKGQDNRPQEEQAHAELHQRQESRPIS